MVMDKREHAANARRLDACVAERRSDDRPAIWSYSRRRWKENGDGRPWTARASG
jgi:hypothetical protein